MAFPLTESEKSSNVNGKKTASADPAAFRDWEDHRNLPDEIIIGSDGREKRMSLSLPARGTLSGRFAAFDQFLVSQLTFELTESTTCTWAGNGESIGLFFTLCGRCLLSDSTEEVTIAQGQHTMYYASESESQVRLWPENGQIQILLVHIPLDYYRRRMQGHSDMQNRFISAIGTRHSAMVPAGVMPITLPMKWIINTMQTNTRTGVLKQLFLQAKVHELLLLQIEQAEVLIHEREKADAPSVEKEALFEAKAILERSFDNPPTIRHLARMVGINEFSLKKGFKDTFQETIYGFVSRLKMEQARQMLLSGDKPIGEVAAMAGYKNPQHFTAAFKKYFGVLPSKLKTG